MQKLLYVDIGSGTVHETLRGTASFSWPTFVQGDQVRLALRLAERIDGVLSEVDRNIVSMRAALGPIDARPVAGSFRLKIGSGATSSGVNETVDIPWNASAKQLQEAINALSVLTSAGLGDSSVESRDGSWLIRFASGSQAEMTLTANALAPLSFGRVREYEVGSGWVHELRLIQTPAAFTSNFERVVPPAPSITRIQSGGNDGGYEWNEVQRLYVPPTFRGTYQIRRGYAKSAIFTVEDGPDAVQEGLQGIADEDGEFVVTLVQDDVLHIEFAGSMAGQSFSLLDVEVFDAPAGDLHISLDLDTAEMAALLRTEDELRMPLEVEAVVEDENDPLLHYTLTLFRTEVVVRRELNWAGMSSPANIDWLRPPQPRDYIPFTPDQIITGAQHYTAVIGDGATVEYIVDHNLDADDIHVSIRENKSGGILLVNGSDYEVTITSNNSITIHTSNVPDENGLAVVITTAGPKSAFQAHTHTIEQIVGLQDVLDNFGSRIVDLEALVPSGGLAVPLQHKQQPTAEWTLPRIVEVYPSRQPVPDEVKAVSEINVQAFRAGGLLPAIHKDETDKEVLPLPLPSDPSDGEPGNLYQNQSGAAVDLPGALGRRSVTIKANEYAACINNNGVLNWYKLIRYDATKTSWYPADFERELFMLSVNDKQLRLKRRLDLQFGLELAILRSNTKARCTVVIEWGSYEQKSDPAVTDTNLKAINWNATPIMEHVIDVTPVPCIHTFGCRILRALQSGADTITASQIIYGDSEMGGSSPNEARFALRARIIKFDTEDSVADPRGLLAIIGLDRSLLEEGEAKLAGIGKATIQPAE